MPRCWHTGEERENMITKETEYRVDCLVRYRPETVYIYHTTYNGETLAYFNGCNFTEESEACGMCRQAAQARFAAEHPELTSVHWRRT